MVATVLTVYGIETPYGWKNIGTFKKVATVLTVYGIETILIDASHHFVSVATYVPFTVLKLFKLSFFIAFNIWLQQYLPFTVCDEGGEAAEA